MKYVDSAGIVGGKTTVRSPDGCRHLRILEAAMDTLVIVISIGLALGYVLGYRVGRAIFFRVGGPFARRPLIVSFVVAGSFLYLVPATMFMVLGARNLGLDPAGPLRSGSPLVMAAVVLGIALIIGSGLALAVGCSTVCGRFIEEVRWSRGRPLDDD